MNEIVKEAIIKSKAIYSDNKEYRYSLVKVWDESKKKAAFIGTNPSKADELKIDITIMNVINMLIDNGYGGVEVVNLYAYISTDQSKLSKRNDKYERENNKYLKNAIISANEIIIGWERCEHKTRKREVLKLIEENGAKSTLCFKDNTGKEIRHPSRGFNDKWEFTKYDSSKEGI